MDCNLAANLCPLNRFRAQSMNSRISVSESIFNALVSSFSKRCSSKLTFSRMNLQYSNDIFFMYLLLKLVKHLGALLACVDHDDLFHQPGRTAGNNSCVLRKEFCQGYIFDWLFLKNVNK